jgi:hypothetical protein
VLQGFFAFAQRKALAASRAGARALIVINNNNNHANNWVHTTGQPGQFVDVSTDEAIVMAPLDATERHGLRSLCCCVA